MHTKFVRHESSPPESPFFNLLIRLTAFVWGPSPCSNLTFFVAATHFVFLFLFQSIIVIGVFLLIEYPIRYSHFNDSSAKFSLTIFASFRVLFLLEENKEYLHIILDGFFNKTKKKKKKSEKLGFLCKYITNRY